MRLNGKPTTRLLFSIDAGEASRRHLLWHAAAVCSWAASTFRGPYFQMAACSLVQEVNFKEKTMETTSTVHRLLDGSNALLLLRYWIALIFGHNQNHSTVLIWSLFTPKKEGVIEVRNFSVLLAIYDGQCYQQYSVELCWCCEIGMAGMPCGDRDHLRP